MQQNGPTPEKQGFKSDKSLDLSALFAAWGKYCR